MEHDFVAGTPTRHALADLPHDAGRVRAADVVVLVVGVDDQPVLGVDDLQRLLTADRIGRAVELSIVRGGAHRRLALVPRELEAR